MARGPGATVAVGLMAGNDRVQGVSWYCKVLAICRCQELGFRHQGAPLSQVLNPLLPSFLVLWRAWLI